MNEVDICNIALSRLGNEARVASIDPPDQSAEAQYCAMFYPMALLTLLNEHNWSFAIKVTTPATFDNADPRWQYCYAMPSDYIKVISVFDSVSGDFLNGASPAAYSVGSTATQDQVLYSNQANASIEYIAMVTNTILFSPSFIDALASKLSIYLAGVILKGDVGASAQITLEKSYQGALEKAIESDAQNRNVTTEYKPEGIAARG